MTDRTNRAAAGHRRAVGVQVCDGCCCGTERKHPGVDHAGIRAALTAATRQAGGHMRIVDCVDECSQSNVVIVRPAGARSARLWFGGVLTDHVVQSLCQWIATGAAAPLPVELAAHVFGRRDKSAEGPGPAPFAVELRTGR